MRLSTITLLIVVATTATMSAQFGFTALDGLPTAVERARDSVGSDATLILLGSGGGVNAGPIPIEFNIDDGKAPLWAYVFRSKQEDRIGTVVVFRLFGYQAFLLGDTPFPIPQALQTIETKGEYSNSSKMAEKLKTNSTFQKYRTDIPKATPSLVILGQLLGQGVPLPNGFPLKAPIWTITYTGQGDSAMTCFVASETGLTFCLRNNRTGVEEGANRSTNSKLWLR